MSEVQLPYGWVMRRIPVDLEGRDTYGWKWRSDMPTWWFGDLLESTTVVCQSPVEALWLVMRDGWPPKSTGRRGWEYKL